MRNSNVVKAKGLQNWSLILMYVFWIGLAALAGLVAWQIYSTLIYLATLLLENPDLRPEEWNTYTISGLARLFLLVIGLLWLGFITFTERYLRLSQNLHHLWRRLGVLVAILLVLFFLAYGIFWIG